jgi:hypothetical protein
MDLAELFGGIFSDEDIATETKPTLGRPKSVNVLDVLSSVPDTASRMNQSIASQTNPALSDIYENLHSKKHLYLDRPVTDRTIKKLAGWGNAASTIVQHPADAVPDEVWKSLDGETQKYLGGVDNGNDTWAVNPYAMTVLTSVVPDMEQAHTNQSQQLESGKLKELLGIE